MSKPAQGGLFACCFGGQSLPASPRGSTKDDTLHLGNSLSLTQGHDIHSTDASLGFSTHLTDGSRQLQQQQPGEADAQRMQEDVLRVVSLLQELLNSSTNALRQPMSKAMALLCTRLPVAYACLYAISPSGLVYQQVSAAVGTEGQLGSFMRTQMAASASGTSLSTLSTPGTPAMRSTRASHSTPHGTPKRPLEFGYAGAKPIAGSGTSVERVVQCGTIVVLHASDGVAEDMPIDFRQLHVERSLHSMLALPIVPSGSSGRMLGVLVLASLDTTDWSQAWWMPSVQLICGWAAGALPQARATARCAFFEQLMGAGSIRELAQQMVHHLPHVLTDQRLNKLECRLALVNSRCTCCTIYTSGLPEEVWEEAGLRQGEQAGNGSIATSGERLPLSLGEGDISRVCMTTQATIMVNALEWGDVMVVKDTVQYFGRSSSLGRDLHLPDRPLPKGTLVLVPLVHKCRMLGCVYVLASWDVNGSISKQAFAELGELLASALFSKLVVGLRQEWFALLTEGAPDVSSASPAGGSTVSGTWDGTISDSTVTSTSAQGTTLAPPATVPSATMPSLPPPIPIPTSSGAQQHTARCFTAHGMSPDSSLGVASMVPGPADLEVASAVSAGTLTRAGSAESSVVNSAATNTEEGSTVSAAEKPRPAPHSHELAYWPELLDVVEDLQKGRHTSVYIASYQGSRVAVKVFRHPEGPEEHGLPPREQDLERQVAALYRLSQLSHPNVVRHLMLFPAIYEVITRKSRDSSSAFLTAVQPRRDKFNRCCALVLELCPHHCSLRVLLSRGVLSQQGQQGALLGTPQLHHRRSSTDTSMPGTAAVSGGGAGDAGLPHHHLQQQLPIGSPLGTSPLATSTSSNLLMLSAAMGAAGNSTQLVLPPPLLPLVRAILSQVASGMHHLHSHGIVHGELRCENILVCGMISAAEISAQRQRRRSGVRRPSDSSTGQASPIYGSSAGVGPSLLQQQLAKEYEAMLEQQQQQQQQQEGQGQQGQGQRLCVKLKDAGISSAALHHKQLVVRKMIGRPRPQSAPYLAPEVFRGEPFSRATDVYAFGLLMWELYCGQQAFANFINTPLKVLQTVVSDGGRPLFPESTPAWYSALAMRCWSTAPKQRPSFRRILLQLQAIEEEPGSS